MPDYEIKRILRITPFADGGGETRKGPRNAKESVRYRKEGDRKRAKCKVGC
jgi:hypothetical protein